MSYNRPDPLFGAGKEGGDTLRRDMRGIQSYDVFKGYTHPIPQGDLEYQTRRNALIPQAENYANLTAGRVFNGKWKRKREVWDRAFTTKMAELWEKEKDTMSGIGRSRPRWVGTVRTLDNQEEDYEAGLWHLFPMPLL